MNLNSKRKKVMLIGPSPSITGGISTWTQALLKSDNEKYEFLLVDSSFGPKGRPRNRILLLAKEIIRTLRIWHNVNSILKNQQISIVHSSSPSSKNALWREMKNAKLAKRHGSKFVLHIHCTVEEFLGGARGMKMLKRISQYVDGFIVLNEQSAVFLNKHLPHANIVKIPNFIKKKYIAVDRGVNERISNVVFVSRVQRKKGIYEYLKLAKHFPSATFYVIGPIIEKLPEIHIYPNVVFTGTLSRDEIIRYLDFCDLFVFLTHYQEGFPMVVLEAMSRGIPQLLSNNETLREISENKGGVLVDYKNINEVIEAFDYLDKNISIREEMVHFNLLKTSNDYEREYVISCLIRFYDKLIIK